jgi:hypothetical protein
MGARRVPSSPRAGPNQRPGAASWSVAHRHVREVQMGPSGWKGRKGAGEVCTATLAVPAAARKAASASREVVMRRPKRGSTHSEGELSKDGVRWELRGGRVVHQEKGAKEHLSFGSSDVGGEPLAEVMVWVRWVRRAWREERSRRILSCVGRGRVVSGVTRFATAAAQERASALTTDIMYPLAPGSRGGGTPTWSGDRTGGPGPGEGAESSGSP